MNSARDQILTAIRRGLGREALGDESRRALERRLGDGTVAASRPQLPASDAGTAFRAALERAAGSLSALPDAQAVPAAVAGYLQRLEIDGPVTVAPALQDLDWRGAGLAPRFGRATGDELAGVSTAFCGIVETGSLVLCSGPATPTSLNFLPEHHLVVLRREDLVDHIEDAWSRLREVERDWPRTVNFITGPSRTADIEQTIQLGAHGPRRLHVLLINSS